MPQSPDRNRDMGWITRPDVEFLNSLHPRGGIEFPQMDEFVGDSLKLEEALKLGFRMVKDRWEAEIPENLDKLNKYELKIYFAIKARTLNYGKLFEKIPERHFRYGIQNDDGTLKMGSNGYPIFSPAGVYDHGNLSRTIRSLLNKRAISRFESDKHNLYGKSYIYTPMHVVALFDTFMTGARDAYVQSISYGGQDEWNCFASIVRSRIPRLMEEVAGQARRSGDRAGEAPQVEANVAAAPDAQAVPVPQVRYRSRSSVHLAKP